MATKATSSSASKNDWILSFGFGEDTGSDSDEDNLALDPSSIAASSTDITQERVKPSLHTFEEARLSHDLDISQREDPAVFQKNPWSIAKLNAASRSKLPLPQYDTTNSFAHQSAHSSSQGLKVNDFRAQSKGLVKDTPSSKLYTSGGYGMTATADSGPFSYPKMAPVRDNNITDY